jgi:hypothetical protein
MTCVFACWAILAWFTHHPEYDAARRDAVLRQAWTESRFDPCAVAASGSSYLMQWLGPRLAELHRQAGTRGCPPIEAQLDFMDAELHRSAHLARFFTVSERDAFGYFRQTFGYGR